MTCNSLCPLIIGGFLLHAGHLERPFVQKATNHIKVVFFFWYIDHEVFGIHSSWPVTANFSTEKREHIYELLVSSVDAMSYVFLLRILLVHSENLAFKGACVACVHTLYPASISLIFRMLFMLLNAFTPIKGEFFLFRNRQQFGHPNVEQWAKEWDTQCFYFFSLVWFAM